MTARLQGGLPSDAVGEDVQEPSAMRHEVLISGGDGFPAVPVFVGGEVEHGQEPGFAVGAVVGEGFAGPFAGDQDPAAWVAEVLAAVGFALARSGP